MNLFGIIVVRNEANVIRLSLLHHLSLGFDAILVLDNGSIDGTAALLESLRQCLATAAAAWMRSIWACPSARMNLSSSEIGPPLSGGEGSAKGRRVGGANPSGYLSVERSRPACSCFTAASVSRTWSL